MRHPNGKFLAVDEGEAKGGWWIPGGAVDSGEEFVDAAHRETWEEAGCKINHKGILKIDHTLWPNDNNGVKMRLIFYAEP